MTHLTPGGAPTAPPAALLSPANATTDPPRRHLDRDQLQAGVAHRRRLLADIEAAMVAACEEAAARRAGRGIRIDDRATWDRAMWQRYLAAASRLEPDYGPRMHRLWREIDQLTRLAALPVAA